MRQALQLGLRSRPGAGWGGQEQSGDPPLWPILTEPGCFPPRAPVLTWTCFCFSPGHHHPSQTPLAPGLILAEGGRLPEGPCSPMCAVAFPDPGPQDLDNRATPAAHAKPSLPPPQATSCQPPRPPGGRQHSPAGSQWPEGYLLLHTRWARQGATLWAGAGKRSFMHKQRHRRCPQAPGPVPWSTSWHPPIPCQLTPMGPLVTTRLPPCPRH